MLVDDHPMMLEGLEGLLSRQQHIEIVGTTNSGSEAVEIAVDLHPDVIVLDISMPDMNGIEAAKRIQAESPTARILFHSVYDDKEYVRQFVASGAKGFITKRSNPQDVLQAIEAVAAGAAFFSPEISATLLEVMVEEKPQSSETDDKELSAREEKILSLIAEGYTNREISDMVFASVRTVETHRRNIMQKLGLHKANELLNYAYSRGYKPRNK